MSKFVGFFDVVYVVYLYCKGYTVKDIWLKNRLGGIYNAGNIIILWNQGDDVL